MIINELSLLLFLQHFVSERKYDEDLGKAVRFTFDLEPLKTSISGFGSGKESCSLFIPRLYIRYHDDKSDTGSLQPLIIQ